VEEVTKFVDKQYMKMRPGLGWWKWGIGGKYLNAELSSPIQATHEKKVQEIFAQ